VTRDDSTLGSARSRDPVQSSNLTHRQASQLEEFLVRGARIMVAGPVSSRPSLFMQSSLVEAAVQCPTEHVRFDQTRLAPTVNADRAAPACQARRSVAVQRIDNRLRDAGPVI
jgi:hypothetical protein